MIPSLMKVSINQQLLTISQTLGYNKPFIMTEHELEIPDTKLTVSATNLSKQFCKKSIFEHSIRTYKFGIAIANYLNELKYVDKEQLYLSCILHDISWNDSIRDMHKYKNLDFEQISADYSREYLINELNYDSKKADIVYDAILYHASLLSLGILNQTEPQINLIHKGAYLDVVGRYKNYLDKNTLKLILEQHPRDNFIEDISDAVGREAKEKPNCAIAFELKYGLRYGVNRNPIDRI